MTKTQKTLAIAFSTILGLVIIVGAMLLADPRIIFANGKLYKQVADYSSRIPNDSGIRSGCMAMSPECGVCPNTDTMLLQDDKCYKVISITKLNNLVQ
jgi:hypothetical protein